MREVIDEERAIYFCVCPYCKSSFDARKYLTSNREVDDGQGKLLKIFELPKFCACCGEDLKG